MGCVYRGKSQEIAAHCGKVRIDMNRVKKRRYAVLTALVLFLLSGCGGQEPPGEKPYLTYAVSENSTLSFYETERAELRARYETRSAGGSSVQEFSLPLPDLWESARIVDISGDGSGFCRIVVQAEDHGQFYTVYDNYEQVISGASLDSGLRFENRGVAEKESSLPQADPAQFHKDAVVTYIHVWGGDELVSCLIDGRQILPENVQPDYSEEYSDLCFRVPRVEQTAQYDAGENTSASNGRSAAMTPVSTNGGWELFPDKAVRETYTIDRQPDRPDWTDYFSRKLAASGWDCPVLIREVLTFSWGGRQAEIVTGSNVLITATDEDEHWWGEDVTGEMLAAAQLPAKRSRSVYRCSVLFLEGAEPMELETYYGEEIPEDGWLGRSDLDLGLLTFFSAAEYRPDGGVDTYRVFCDDSTELNLRYWGYAPRFLICDLDGDGRSELVYDHDDSSSLYHHTFIYRLGEYGAELIRYFGV